MTSKKKPFSALNAWFIERKATPSEMKIYKIVVEIFNANGNLPVENPDIRTKYKNKKKTHRKTIQSHLSKMIKKGMIIRYRYRQYLPVVPETFKVVATVKS